MMAIWLSDRKVHSIIVHVTTSIKVVQVTRLRSLCWFASFVFVLWLSYRKVFVSPLRRPTAFPIIRLQWAVVTYQDVSSNSHLPIYYFQLWIPLVSCREPTPIPLTPLVCSCGLWTYNLTSFFGGEWYALFTCLRLSMSILCCNVMASLCILLEHYVAPDGNPH